MNKAKKTLLIIAGLAALALGGSALANATGGGDNSSSDSPDTPITGSDASRAGSAARDAVGGGSVESVEASDEGGSAVFEVKVAGGGKVTEVQVDKAFHVTGQKADDDKADSSQDHGDGDGETNDD